jgi:tetratricopeptide (TPR) repeat protein
MTMAETHLDTLEARGMVRLVDASPELEYLFRHWLVQDAAYGSLLKQERRHLHGLVGESLEQIYPDRRAELAGILALHFEQAGDREKAIDYLLIEGRYGLERNAIREAFAAFDRAASLLPADATEEDEAGRRRRVEIVFGRSRAGWTFRPPEEMVAQLDSIIPAAEALGDLELVAEIHLHLALILLEGGMQATDPTVQRALGRLAELGEALEDPSLGAMPLAMVGLNKVFLGPIREGVRALALAIPRMERRRDFIGAAFARGWLATGYGELGEFDRAEAALKEAIDQAAQGDLVAQLDAQISEAMIRAARGQLDDALPIAQACVARSEESGATACAVVSTWILGDIYQRQGRFTDAHDVLQKGMILSPVTGVSSVWRPTIQAWLGTTLVTLGMTADDGAFEEALEGARRIGNRLGEAKIRWKRAEARTRQDRLPEALEDFAASAAIWEEEGARPSLARVQRAWGEALVAAGEPAEAAARLSHALALFEELGIEREAAEVRAILVSTAGG